jgi:DNA-binding NtrC family response regulator
MALFECSTDLVALGMVGRSPCFLAALAKACRIATRDVPLLLSGETGTGKEVFARAVHYGGHRAGFPMIAVNCGAIPEHLFENELFGHAKGAFTDARESFAGLIQQANRGTLFLDEIEAMPLGGQVKLLRFLEDHSYRPLGSSAGQSADVRIIAATNESLKERVNQRTFREDLYYRLNVVTIDLPPLRFRVEDIEPLANHFLRRAISIYRGPERTLSSDAVDTLRGYHWPGNIRELRNVVEAAYLLAETNLLTSSDLSIDGGRQRETLDQEEAPDSGGATSPGSAGVLERMKAAKAKVVREFESVYLKRALAAANGNITQAARIAGKDRRALFALLKKHSIL